jgi:hypothetical protein
VMGAGNGAGRPHKAEVVAAYDPGVVTGWAIWGEEGLLCSGQGSAEEAMLRSLPFLRQCRVALVAIEAPFLGRGAKASLSVASSSGWVKGALWAAGIDPPEWWMPLATAWRRELGWDVMLEGKRKQRKDWEAEARSFAAPHVGQKLLVKQTHQAEAVCIASAAWERWIERKEQYGWGK